MTTALTFRLDLPPRVLSPNMTRNVHWTKKNEQVVEYKHLVEVNALNAARAAGWQAPYLARVSLCWHLLDKRPAWLKSSDPRYKPMDPDNAIGASKALFDGLTKAKVIRDDTWDHLEIGRIWCTHESGPYVMVTIEAVVSQNGLGI